ncbi:MAG TPA: cupredoxin family copper-binding protein [Candidatus Acidoferrum sp.]|nr:cupredoxin family copper-binding protein [Candidatus Acidoferrum sp.]
MKRIVPILGTGILLVAALAYATTLRKQTHAATLAPQAAAEMTATVKIDNFSFSPATLEIKAGTTVTWTNADDIPHTVVSNDKVFKSKALDTDEKFSFKFDKAGSYPYFCSLHPKMTAKVVVQ